eukprot:CAMPEP_0117026756 /NCGR_PEP_ID=MMETSP0472-20121206/19639_1 /TAXON_ID=693140 ORGANISM="Tiarina fusus, Strain LIS" /NCGR_SAMPLE_ID=MMETSP0472 /ASSEMBLY_ACC=CAM_ASM_000603 /LENGTH=338 /DNA_ID=CAMNT_0004733849 /DNA_START=278 /DNA_END=1294 /DNA_ORIENTATION=+
MTLNAHAWGGSSNGEFEEGIYGNTFTRDWLYESKSLSFKVEGCAWGYVEDSEEVGCLEDESEDGTTNWYMMANCRRPQVVFSVYASDSSSTSCNSNNFVGSFVTTGGVSEFIYYLQTYAGAGGLDDDAYGEDNLPNCEQANDGGYVGLDCSDGAFTINYFNDEYCVSRTGTTYNEMYGLNSLIGTYESCTASNGYNNDDDGGNSIVHKLVYYSDACTSLDYDLCSDNEAFEERSASSGKSRSSHKKWSSRAYIGGHKSWVTKLKYVVGGLFLLASFIMFTGILFTNRRRRRAMMMRKYRQAKKQKRDKNRDSSSRKSRSASKKRSKSRTRDKHDGVFT